MYSHGCQPAIACPDWEKTLTARNGGLTSLVPRTTPFSVIRLPHNNYYCQHIPKNRKQGRPWSEGRDIHDERTVLSAHLCIRWEKWSTQCQSRWAQMQPCCLHPPTSPAPWPRHCRKWHHKTPHTKQCISDSSHQSVHSHTYTLHTHIHTHTHTLAYSHIHTTYTHTYTLHTHTHTHIHTHMHTHTQPYTHLRWPQGPCNGWLPQH